MTTILESISALATPELLAPIAKKIGVDPTLLSKGVGAIAPLITTGLARAAATPEGLKSVMSLLPAEATDDIAGLTKTVLSSPSAGTLLNQFADTVFGGGVDTATRAIDKALGIPASALTPLLAPLVLNTVKQAQAAGNLDDKGLARLLKSESDAFLKAGSPEAEMVKGAWTNVDRLNDIRARFTPEELMAAGGAPLAVAGLVMNASPSSMKGVMQEFGAFGKAMDLAAEKTGGVSLIDLFPRPTPEEMEGFMAAPRENMIGTIQKGVAAVGAKMPESLENYKAFLNSLAAGVASAAKEGGFLGIGDKAVTKEEAAAIEAIKQAVG
jgi:hypothetical protein